jgi:hypothetical protein
MTSRIMRFFSLLFLVILCCESTNAADLNGRIPPPSPTKKSLGKENRGPRDTNEPPRPVRKKKINLDDSFVYDKETKSLLSKNASKKNDNRQFIKEKPKSPADGDDRARFGKRKRNSDDSSGQPKKRLKTAPINNKKAFFNLPQEISEYGELNVPALIEKGKITLALIEKESLWMQKDCKSPLLIRDPKGLKAVKDFQKEGALVFFVDNMRNNKVKSELKNIAKDLLGEGANISTYLNEPNAAFCKGILHVADNEHKKNHIRDFITYVAEKNSWILKDENKKDKEIKLIVYHIYSNHNDNKLYTEETTMDNYPLECEFEPIFYSPNIEETEAPDAVFRRQEKTFSPFVWAVKAEAREKTFEEKSRKLRNQRKMVLDAVLLPDDAILE